MMEILNINNGRQDFMKTKLMHGNGTLRSIKQRRNHKISIKQDDENNNNKINNNVSVVNNVSDNNNIKIVDSGNNTNDKQVNITLSKMSLLWNTSGWIRVYCGPDRSDVSCEDPSRMVHIITNAMTLDVVKDMDLPLEYTLWLQIGGTTMRRLEESEHPLLVQEEFLKNLGYLDESRRARLGIDPDMKHLIRFHIGPAEIPMCRGVMKSGSVEILKGLVFPQWRRRFLAIIGSKLVVFPGNPSLTPEVYELAGADIFEHTPGYNRLIIKVVPKTSDSVYSTNDNLNRIKSLEYLNGGTTNIYNSNCSVYSTSNNNNSSNANGNEKETVLFLGFEESWERDLWSIWLLETTSLVFENKKLDIGESGLQHIPEIFLQSSSNIEEILAGGNKLQEMALRALGEFKHLKVLRLNGNGFKTFPDALFNLKGLMTLDLQKNYIQKIPDKVVLLENLQDLNLERNELTDLPNTFRKLSNLKVLNVSYNRLNNLPSFLANMRSVGLFENYNHNVNGIRQTVNNRENSDENRQEPPLTRVNLRGNQLKGSIILGNYGLLTQLDVSENSIEVMDLSALDKLETIQCCRNNLKELTLNGRYLTSLVAGNNHLSKLMVRATPTNLRHIDLSFNNMNELPDWLVGCHQLRTLYANNNNITAISEHLLNNEHATIHSLQLAYNNLKSFPQMLKRKLPLQQLFLQCNQIEDLPENFFIACERLTILNVSSNKLMTLPIVYGNNLHMERLYATNNCLTDRVLDSLICLNNLKVLHLAYNVITTLPESCINCWIGLEELILSGNKLQHLPENLANLHHLRVLRVHSNQLQSVPALARTSTLRVLDLAHNQLDKINMVSLVPKKLQFLDLSCNQQLQVDPQQLQVCRSQRPMSLVDVSGKNRASLPTTPWPYQENEDFEPPWKVGFSETSGSSQKLYISQLRLPGFCNSEGLFGIFDGELNNIVPNLLVKAIPKILLEERTVKETANDYMKYTLLSAHRELKQQGQNNAVHATLCHISRSKLASEGMSYLPHGGTGRKFILRIASVGESGAVLVKHNRCIKLNILNSNKRLGGSSNYPITVPDPDVYEVPLGDTDEYLVLANKKLWEVVTMDTVADEIRKEENILLAAKRIQDVAQSYGVDGNLSIIVIKFNNLGTDIDFLMRELRQTIRKKPVGGSIISGFCKCGCCCESNNSCCHSGAGSQFMRHPSARSDRSSPSGQSDNTSASDVTQATAMKQRSYDSSTIGSRKSNAYLTNERRSLRGGVVRAVRARIEEEKEREVEETDSALSEEQFKCWEYMLEQNTQLLFDKELNTLSRAYTKRPQSNLLRAQMKALSSSSPQLAHDENSTRISNYNTLTPNSKNVPFLSKHFGSARSFQPTQSQSFFKPIRYNPGRAQTISGGPNAAYFGSLQRLMPYNLEYDFNLVQDSGAPNNGEDSLENEGGRMQQYWGVATTEL